MGLDLAVDARAAALSRATRLMASLQELSEAAVSDFGRETARRMANRRGRWDSEALSRRKAKFLAEELQKRRISMAFDRFPGWFSGRQVISDPAPDLSAPGRRGGLSERAPQHLLTAAPLESTLWRLGKTSLRPWLGGLHHGRMPGIPDLWLLACELAMHHIG